MAYQFPDGPTAPREKMAPHPDALMMPGLRVLSRPEREIALVTETVNEVPVLGVGQDPQVADGEAESKDLQVLSISIVMSLVGEVEAPVARVR